MEHAAAAGPADPSAAAAVEVRLFAAARAAAGGRTAVSTTAGSLAEVQERLAAAHGDPMARVLRTCSFLVDGVAVGRGQDRSLVGVRTVDVLPPFAGG